MYEVGQILYTILENKYKVIPLKISEQVITKTLEKESITYKAIIPGKKKIKVNLNEVSNIWDNLEEVENHLLNNAKSAVSKMIEESNSLRQKFFKEEINNKDDLSACNNELNGDIIKHDDYDDNIESKIKVDLGNGQIANLINPIEDLDQKKNEESSTA